jgi:trimeric autotransporter adhesin
MKKIIQKTIRTVLILIALCSLQFVVAQVPQKMNYQAILRNANNSLITNTTVGIKISILSTSTAIAYSESHTATTNENGLVTLEIGGGTPLLGTFAGINWANGSYSVKTETDPTGGTNYTITGTSQLLSVPYALYAANSGGGSNSPQWATNGNNISNLNSGNVGIGTTSSAFKLNVKSTDDAIASFESGTDRGAIAIAENGINRGYIGSVWGKPEDVDFGTYGGNTTGSVHLTTNGTARLTVSKEGYVGIGSDTPSSKLEVKSSDSNIATFDGGNQTYITLAENGVYRGYIGTFSGKEEDVDFGTYSNNTTGSVHLTTNNNPKLTVVNNGNVGIGTTTPTSKLNVNGQLTIDQKNFGGYGGLLIKGDGPGSNYPNIAMTVKNTNNQDVVAGYIGGAITNKTAGSEAMNLSFLTSESGLSGLSEKMTIKSNGNIGIGNSNPNAPLQFSNTGGNRKAVLFDINNNENEFYGFGINAGVLRYQVSTTTSDHVFYAGNSATTSKELLRIKGTGAIAVNGNTGTAGQVLSSNGAGAAAWSKPMNYDSTPSSFPSGVLNMGINVIGSVATVTLPALTRTITVPNNQNAKLFISCTFNPKGRGCSGLFCVGGIGRLEIWIDGVNTNLSPFFSLDNLKESIVSIANVPFDVSAGSHTIEFKVGKANNETNDYSVFQVSSTVFAIPQ